MLNRNSISSRIFATIYSGIIGWFIASSLLGFTGTYFLDFLIISLMILEMVGCLFVTLKIARRYPIAEADAEEIKREDDVLLQGTPFVSAILLFYLNIIVSDTNSKIILADAIVFLTVSFYVVRAYAKIKSSPIHRLFSAVLLVWLAGSFVFLFLVAFFPYIFPTILTLPPLVFVLFGIGLAIIPILLTALGVAYLRQRYGVKTVRRLKVESERKEPK